MGLTSVALKAREDFHSKRVKIHFWKTFSGSKGEFHGAEFALAVLVQAMSALNNIWLCEPRKSGLLFQAEAARVTQPPRCYLVLPPVQGGPCALRCVPRDA